MSSESNVRLPFLPGYSFDRPQHKKHHGKKQCFAVENGTMVVDKHRDRLSGPAARRTHTSLLPEAVEAELEEQVAQGTSGLHFYHRNQEFASLGTSSGDAAASGTQRPGRQTLSFRGYFRQEVPSSTAEEWRVRYIKLRYFLEDNSLSISEPRTDNSGMPQGTLLKRQRVPKSTRSYLEATDLNVGENIEIYGTVYRITDCDDFTRDFLEAQGVAVGPSEEAPADPYTTALAAKRERIRHGAPGVKTMAPKAGGVNVAKTTKFLKHDGKVLRFYCAMVDREDATQPPPDAQAFVLTFFMADDSVSVSQVRAANSGREQFPTLLKRQKLPKDYRRGIASVATIGSMDDPSESGGFYTEEDFAIGQTVNVFGRYLLLCAADSYTQEFYEKHFGRSPDEFIPIDMVQPEPEPQRPQTPPYTGFGSEDDYGTRNSLVPKPARKNLLKMQKYDGKNLCFRARFTKPSVEDFDREFVVTFFMADDTVSVFERATGNSGFRNGKFLQRCRLKNPATGTWFAPQDFYIGAVLTVNSYEFILGDSDEFTLSFMECAPNLFPRADANAVFDSLASQGLTKANFADVTAGVSEDEATGAADKDQFAEALRQAGFEIDDHQILTLVRKFSRPEGRLYLSDVARELP